jgi:hypothetical protein
MRSRSNPPDHALTFAELTGIRTGWGLSILPEKVAFASSGFRSLRLASAGTTNRSQRCAGVTAPHH